MSSIKSTSSASASAVTSQPETNTKTKLQETNSESAKSSTPTAQESKSSQQLATAKKEEFGLSTISKTLNAALDVAKRLGNEIVSESKIQSSAKAEFETAKTVSTIASKPDAAVQPQKTSTSGSFAEVAGIDTSNLIQMNLLNTQQQSAQTTFARFPTKTMVSTPELKTSPSNEEMFNLCEKGHEKPNTIINSPEDADKSVQNDYQEYLSATPNSKLPSTLTLDSDQSSGLNSEGHDVSRWLDENFLGTTIHERFSKTPPIFTTVPQNYFDAQGVDAASEYTKGTNHIRMTSGITNEADRRRLLVHEQLHYASNLGGGDPSNMRWRDESGQPIMNGTKPSALWLHEGLNELHAQQLTRSMGFKTTESSYPQELRAAHLIQKVVDDDELVRDAFLTGNFTEVRRRVDEKLPSGSPEGTFDRIMGASTPNEALMILNNSITEAGIDSQPWLQDPLLSIARPRVTITK